jgi:hypothetical protein
MLVFYCRSVRFILHLAVHRTRVQTGLPGFGHIRGSILSGFGPTRFSIPLGIRSYPEFSSIRNSVLPTRVRSCSGFCPTRVRSYPGSVIPGFDHTRSSILLGVRSYPSSVVRGFDSTLIRSYLGFGRIQDSVPPGFGHTRTR